MTSHQRRPNKHGFCFQEDFDLVIYINILINNEIEIEIGTKIGREIMIENNIHFYL